MDSIGGPLALFLYFFKYVGNLLKKLLFFLLNKISLFCKMSQYCYPRLPKFGHYFIYSPINQINTTIKCFYTILWFSSIISWKLIAFKMSVILHSFAFWHNMSSAKYKFKWWSIPKIVHTEIHSSFRLHFYILVPRIHNILLIINLTNALGQYFIGVVIGQLWSGKN